MEDSERAPVLKGLWASGGRQKQAKEYSEGMYSTNTEAGTAPTYRELSRCQLYWKCFTMTASCNSSQCP